ncbi:unnamed protein product [Paramecium octaurelia]|uniref:Uncharacterized protein n=1 Tax=Paramecium octaurelia TaxID=43137 RepID=A0A8S1YSL7_PAROT|nr:unnamed protein product [Paramecium octaurelia]
MIIFYKLYSLEGQGQDRAKLRERPPLQKNTFMLDGKTGMKEVEINTNVNGSWAKYSLMGASDLITSKILINKTGQEKRFFKNFQIDACQNPHFLSENSVRIQREGYFNFIPYTIQAKIMIHRLDQFPDRESQVCRKIKKTLHLIIDEIDVFHNEPLQRRQIDNLEVLLERQET